MPQPTNPDRREQELARLVLHLAVGLLGTLPLLADAVARSLGWHIFFFADGRLQLVFAGLVLIAAGWPLFPIGFRRPGLLQGAFLLSGIGLFGYSAYLAVLVGAPGHDLHFDWAAGLAVLALCLRIRAAR